FEDGVRAITTFRNRTDRPLAYTTREACFAFWERRELQRGDVVTIAPHGTEALVVDRDAREAHAHFDRVSRAADVDLPHVESPRIIPPPRVTVASTSRAKMIEIPGGPFHMRITHQRRECGCWDHAWGSPHAKMITHDAVVTLEPYAIRADLVTHAEFLAFVRASGFRPEDPARFLLNANGDPDAPVTYVSLADARAFAAFEGHRLPTEAEWQRAGLATPLWELTESEHTDGHTRFVMLRAGSPLPKAPSEWHAPRGPQPIESHAKYILLADALDRSETISFRTVRPR
ncbi:MAG TPA: SUMF1/EgtB/PvdO family nonheme iron enzyme, partial [Polyangiaceae bacterium]